MLEGKNGHGDVYLPDKAVIRYREWYGWNGKPNEGLRLESPEIAKQLMKTELDAGEHMDYRVADTQLWAKNDGPSMADRMKDATGGQFLPRQALKDRQAGYAEICLRLRGEKQEDGSFMPMFYVTENCTQFWRTVPPLILDDLHPEKGPDNDQENHVYDELSYSLTSWPYITTQISRIERAFYSTRRKAKLTSSDPYRMKKA